jgi:hypothetical protein
MQISFDVVGTIGVKHIWRIYLTEFIPLLFK